jgi:peptide deformylase
MQPVEVEGEELLARALCHELDHLDGVMYTSKVEGELYDTTEEEAEEEEAAEEGES